MITTLTTIVAQSFTGYGKYRNLHNQCIAWSGRSVGPRVVVSIDRPSQDKTAENCGSLIRCVIAESGRSYLVRAIGGPKLCLGVIFTSN